MTERSYSAEEVRQVAFEAAGLGSVTVMRLAPHIVLPAEDITEGVEAILADCRDRVGTFKPEDER